MNIFDKSLLHNSWKSRPSRQEGYYKNYYSDTSRGDHIEIDFNYPRQMARISLKPADEPGKEYAVVIKSGTILQERDVTRRRPLDLNSRFSRHARLFSYLRDESILKVIGGNYGLPTKPIFSELTGDFNDAYKRFKSIRKKKFLEKLKNYLEKKHHLENLQRPFYSSLLRRLPAEILDISIGFALIAFYLSDAVSSSQFATLSGFMGLSMGAVDWVWRQRNPFLPKIVFMLSLSGFAVFNQIQHRMWGMFI